MPLYDKDWHAKKDVTVADQSVGLPNIGTVILFKITPPLKHKVDLDKWINKVEKILESHNSQNLIKKDVF